MMGNIITVRPVHGICHMVVCAEKGVTDVEILEHCNQDNPSGTQHGWGVVVRKDVERPTRNPVQCVDDPDRIHYLVGC